MLKTVAANIQAPIDSMQEKIDNGTARIAKLRAPKADDPEGKLDMSCGVSVVSRMLGKKSECSKIEEDLVRYREHLKQLEAKRDAFTETYPMLNDLVGLDKYMLQDTKMNLEVTILDFLQKNKGSILHTFADPDTLGDSLTALVERAAEV